MTINEKRFYLLRSYRTIVAAYDIAEEKLHLAQEYFGADHTILNGDSRIFLEQVNEITGGRGFDVTVEAVGIPSTFLNCVDAAAFGGRVVVIGVSKSVKLWCC